MRNAPSSISATASTIGGGDRDLAFGELVLEVARVRRDHDAVVVAGGVQQRGEQVGERLPGPCPRLDRQLAAMAEDRRERRGHLLLPVSPLEAGHQVRAVRQLREQRIDVGVSQRLVVVGRHERRGRLGDRRQRQSGDDGGGLLLVDAGKRVTTATMRECVLDQPRGWPLRTRGEAVQLEQQRARQRLQALQQLDEHLGGADRVGQRAVRDGHLDPERLGQRGEVQPVGPGEQDRGQFPGVVRGAPRDQIFGLEEVEVELDVLPDDRQIADELGQLRHDAGRGRRRSNRDVVDTGQLLHFRRDRLARIDQGLPPLLDARATKAHDTDLDDRVGLDIEPGRLEVERDERIDPVGRFAIGRRARRLGGSGLGVWQADRLRIRGGVEVRCRASPIGGSGVLLRGVGAARLELHPAPRV